MLIFRIFILSQCITSFAFAQDSLYTRKTIKYLTSSKCYGRGYLKGGLHEAEKFIVKEIAPNLKPLFESSFTQSFYHAVNTFPGKFSLKMNGKKLRPGVDFIPDAGSRSLCGTFNLEKKDSVTFSSKGEKPEFVIKLKKKLTYTVARSQAEYCIIELDQNKVPEIPIQAEVLIESKLNIDFESKNIGGYIPGKNSDSMMVFTAHYDHLGGIGKKTFFPGANDNASGVSVLLNLIKHYQKFPPRYKTIFIFFAGEEAGLLGSKYFVENNSIDLSKIKFLINLDLLGTGDDGIMVVNGAVHETTFNTLTKINAESRLVKEIKKRGKAANSDHYWFSEKGVPCFFIYTMGGITAYHDVYDVEKTLPLTKYRDIFNLITKFVDQL